MTRSLVFSAWAMVGSTVNIVLIGSPISTSHPWGWFGVWWSLYFGWNCIR